SRPKAELEYAAAIANPKEYRGKLIHRRGIVAWRRADKLKDADVAGISDVYRGILTDTDGSDGIAFDMTEPFPDLESRRDLVDIEGVYYRTLLYENNKGKKTLIPYVLARTIKVIDPATLKKSFDSTPNVLGLAI